MLSAVSCFTVKASKPEPKLDCGNAAGQEPRVKAYGSARGWSSVYTWKIREGWLWCPAVLDQHSQKVATNQQLNDPHARVSGIVWTFHGHSCSSS